jgi:hypothetical protein
MTCFRGLTVSRAYLPLPAPLVLGTLPYGTIGYVVARYIDRSTPIGLRCPTRPDPTRPDPARRGLRSEDCYSTMASLRRSWLPVR